MNLSVESLIILIIVGGLVGVIAQKLRRMLDLDRDWHHRGLHWKLGRQTISIT
jgi:hypothetical protein